MRNEQYSDLVQQSGYFIVNHGNIVENKNNILNINNKIMSSDINIT